MANKPTAWNLKKADELKKSLEATTKRLDAIVNEIATTKQTTNTYWNNIQRQINKEYETLRMISKEWTEETIPLSYRKSAQYEISKVKNKTVKLNQDVQTRKMQNSNKAKQSVGAMAQETTATFTAGYESGKKTMTRLARMTQQVNVREAEINRAIQEGFVDTGSIRGPIINTRDALLKQALDGKYITVIDKNGNTIQYKVNTYAEMVARTKLQETNTQAVIDTAFSIGNDLLQVSSHNTKTAICAVHEGKIYSITGESKDFPQLYETTPFHPNCIHVMTNVFQEALEQQGILEEYSEFSKGETLQHPTRKKFIPLNERELV